MHRDEINCHKGCKSAAFDRGMTRAKKNQEAEWEKKEHCVPSNNISKKESFTVYSCRNQTYKRPAHSLERTVCLTRQQQIRERIGNKGGKIFI